MIVMARKRSGKQQLDPTPKEIAVISAAIRKSWRKRVEIDPHAPIRMSATEERRVSFRNMLKYR